LFGGGAVAMPPQDHHLWFSLVAVAIAAQWPLADTVCDVALSSYSATRAKWVALVRMTRISCHCKLYAGITR
jgi:hypothetical protein